MKTSPSHYLTISKDNRHQTPGNIIRPNSESWDQRQMCINTVTFHAQSWTGIHYLNHSTIFTIWTISRLYWLIVECSFFRCVFCFVFSTIVMSSTRYCFATLLSIILDVDVRDLIGGQDISGSDFACL